MYRQQLKDTPKEVLNRTLGFAVLVFGMLGAARGLDEGIISGTVSQKSFISTFGLHSSRLTPAAQANLLGNITSMVQIGSVAGSLLAFYLCDRIGRLRSLQQLCLVWILGISITITANGRIGQLYAGRFIAGLGIGQTTVVAPTYLAEISPRSIRGLCMCMFSGSVYVGILLGYFANWGTSMHISNTDQKQWILPTTMHLMFAGLIFILSFFAKESPRWLMKMGRTEQATATMSSIRRLPEDHPYVQTELIDIKDQLEREKEATMGTTIFGPLRELFMIPSNRYRIMLGLMSQLLGQWSGSGSITIYAPTFFAMLGTTGQNEKLFQTAIFGVVKFVSSLACALFVVDLLGRKRALGAGISLQFLSIFYIALYLAINPAITNPKHAPQSPSQRRAGTLGIVMIYVNGIGWALGWNSIQYLINAEIFPLRVRALGSSLVMCFHFANQYGQTKAVPNMLISLKPWGTFLFFACTTVVGGLWTWFFLPETSGRSLEGMDELFSLDWRVIGRKGAEMTRGRGGVAEAYDQGGVEKAELAEVENVAAERRRSSRGVEAV